MFSVLDVSAELERAASMSGLNVATTLDWLAPVIVPFKTPGDRDRARVRSRRSVVASSARKVMLNGVLLYVVVWPAGRAATWKDPRGMFEVRVDRWTAVIGTKLITFAPVTPSLDVVRSIPPCCTVSRECESALVPVDGTRRRAPGR